MSIDKITLSGDGVRDLLRSPEIQRHLKALADRVAAAAGPDHEVDSSIGPNRARATVSTTTSEAFGRELKQHTLIQALDAAR